MKKYQILIEDVADGLVSYECMLFDANSYMQELREDGIYAICCEINEENMEVVFSMKSVANKVKHLNSLGGK